MAAGIVTINTDASFSYSHNKGSYAFWVVSDYGKLCRYGALKGGTKTPTHGEFKCIVNALHCLFVYLKWPVTKIIVNTDSMNSIHLLKNNKEAIRRYRIGKNQFTEELAAWHSINGRYISKKIEIDFRHVRAHTENTNARSWVNQWCDTNAKMALANELKRIGSLPPSLKIINT
jgi:ribonuclease HI